MSYNKVILLGNLTRDPEVKFTPKGSAVCKFGMALNRKWKNEVGDQKEEVTFVDVTAWGKSGETLAQYVKKGDMLHIDGRLNLESWDDKATGQKRTKLSVVMETFSLIGSKRGGSEAATPRATPKVKAEGEAEGEAEADDIPF